MKFPVFLFYILISHFALCQRTDQYWLLKENKDGATGYIDHKGNIQIPFGKYEQCFTDTFRTIAFVSKAGKILAINKNEQELFEVYNFDNGPDYPREGLIRIIIAHKIGFADMSGKILVKPSFVHAHPFSEGLALVTLDTNQDSTSTFGYTDKNGVLTFVFDAVDATSFENGKARIQTLTEEYYINKEGYRIK